MGGGRARPLRPPLFEGRSAAGRAGRAAAAGATARGRLHAVPPRQAAPTEPPPRPPQARLPRAVVLVSDGYQRQLQPFCRRWSLAAAQTNSASCAHLVSPSPCPPVPPTFARWRYQMQEFADDYDGAWAGALCNFAYARKNLGGPRRRKPTAALCNGLSKRPERPASKHTPTTASTHPTHKPQKPPNAVVAVDQRGYNDSSKPEGVASYRVAQLARDVKALVGALGHKRCTLVAHDWGGTVAWAVRHARACGALWLGRAASMHCLRRALRPARSQSCAVARADECRPARPYCAPPCRRWPARERGATTPSPGRWHVRNRPS
jgi:hypothetical protein